jgi:hypothetical protein
MASLSVEASVKASANVLAAIFAVSFANSLADCLAVWLGVGEPIVMACCHGFGWLFLKWLSLVCWGLWFGFVGLSVFCVYGVYM